MYSSSTSRTSLSGSAECLVDSAFQKMAESSENPPEGPIPTSRTSVTKIVSVVSSFDEFKRSLVHEIGWGGILNIPALNRLNLKFSKWTMSRVDVPGIAVALDDSRKIKFLDADIHKVFGILCGTRDIFAEELNCSDNTKQQMRNALGMPDKGNNVLKYAEIVLLRPLSDKTSSNLEVDCFKRACVIFCMGHLFAPSTRHDSATIDYWGALSKTDQITEFNWCQYILLDMVGACQHVQYDILNSRLVTYLHGCHVFLQIFLLDNLDLGIYNMRHDIFPRIAAFDDNKLRGMILQCTNPSKGAWDYSIAQIRHPESVCYTRARAKNVPNINYGFVTKMPPSASSPFLIHRKANIGINQQTATVSPGHEATHVPKSATEFANYLKTNYPNLASTDLGILLKRHNAIAPLQATLLKNALIQENTRFHDSFMSILSDSCLCCRIRDLPCCIQKPTHQDSTSTSCIRPQRLDMNRFEEPTSACSLTSSSKKNNYPSSEHSAPIRKKLKANLTEEPHLGLYHIDNVKMPIQHNMPPKSNSIEQAKRWAETVVGGILLFSEEHDLPYGAVVFGQLSPNNANKIACQHTEFATNHWSLGRSLKKPQTHIFLTLHSKMFELTKEHLSSQWITHVAP
ncbi:hypothetical protein ACQJBY_042871 [Aegilops geniculata]